MKKILLIGDSIRQGYDVYTRMAFEGKAQVFFPSDNCRFTTYIIRNLLDWKKQLECGDDVDLVHWNAGLWDDLVMIDGQPVVDIDTYRRNVDRICGLIRQLFPQAKIIFATSTPVQEELFPECKRYNRDTERYNAVASEVVRQHGGTINDLYTLMVGHPVSYHSDLTHYYTKDGTRVITNQVVACIEQVLGIQATPLDYDALFAGKEDAVGM